MSWVPTVRTLMASGFYRDNLVKMADECSSAVEPGDHRVCAFVVRGIANEMASFWEDPVSPDWVRTSQETLWPPLYALLDLLSGQHSESDVMEALGRAIRASNEAVARFH